MASSTYSIDSHKLLENNKISTWAKKPFPCTPLARTKEFLPEDRYIQKIRNIPMQRKVQCLDKVYELSSLLGAGDYSNVYLIKDHPEMVVKFYRAHKLTCKPSKVRKRIEYILKQYGIFSLIDPKTPLLHQAKIMNFETAIEDGFLLVERIPESFPEPSWDVNTKFSQLGEDDKHILFQIQKIFSYINKNKINIDVKRDNVGLNNRTVKLFDWSEEPDEEDELNLHIRNKINTFARGKDGLVNPDIFDFLCPTEIDTDSFQSHLQIDS
jgi:hypothetical protein